MEYPPAVDAFRDAFSSFSPGRALPLQTEMRELEPEMKNSAVLNRTGGSSGDMPDPGCCFSLIYFLHTCLFIYYSMASRNVQLPCRSGCSLLYEIGMQLVTPLLPAGNAHQTLIQHIICVYTPLINLYSAYIYALYTYILRFT